MLQFISNWLLYHWYENRNKKIPYEITAKITPILLFFHALLSVLLRWNFGYEYMVWDYGYEYKVWGYGYVYTVWGYG